MLNAKTNEKSNARPLCTTWCNPASSAHAKETRRVSLSHGRFWPVTREHIVSARTTDRRRVSNSPSRSPRCTSAPSPFAGPRAASLALLRNNNNTGWLAMAILRNSSRRQRVSVYKHCKVTHWTAVSSLPFRHPRSLFEPLSRVTSRDLRSQRRRAVKDRSSRMRARFINNSIDEKRDWTADKFLII